MEERKDWNEDTVEWRAEGTGRWKWGLGQMLMVFNLKGKLIHLYSDMPDKHTHTQRSATAGNMVPLLMKVWLVYEPGCSLPSSLELTDLLGTSPSSYKLPPPSPPLNKIFILQQKCCFSVSRNRIRKRTARETDVFYIYRGICFNHNCG